MRSYLKLLLLVTLMGIVASSDSGGDAKEKKPEQKKPLMERATSEELKQETLERYTRGKHKRSKKANAFSRAMSARNAAFRRSLLSSNATSAADLFAKSRSASRGVPEGFEIHATPAIQLADDLCTGAAVECGDDDVHTRRIDGRCNNLDYPLWGSAGIPFRRLAVPRYQDGEGSPTRTCPAKEPFRGMDRKRSRSEGGVDGVAASDAPPLADDDLWGCCPDDVAAPGTILPNARTVSASLHSDTNVSSALTHMITQFGQFLDHDLTLTPEVEAHDCCLDPTQDECNPIDVDSCDPYYSPHNVKCLELTRSEAFCEENGGTRAQFNAITAFVDASAVYGSDYDHAMRLRKLEKGKMKMTNELLPYTADTTDEADARDAGDGRVNEMPGLAAMHTLWVREHNRVADEIAANGGAVDAMDDAAADEEIYQRARKVVIAELQQVTYGEYLPHVLGTDLMEQLGICLPEPHGPEDGFRIPRTEYDPTCDPGMFNSFATAAYRFGHSMIQGLVQLFTVGGGPGGYYGEYAIGDNFFNMTMYDYQGGHGMEQILAGLINQPAQTNDEFVTWEVTNKLFKEKGEDFGSDLAARNIQRGRDHGLAGWGAYRKACGLTTIAENDLCSWADDKRPADIPLERWHALRDVYSPNLPRDMDLFSVGLMESPTEPASDADPIVGATFACIIGRQFKSLMDGDRHFFTHGLQDQDKMPQSRVKREATFGQEENDAKVDETVEDPDVFRDVLTDAQLSTVLKRTLRDILCDNTGISHAQPDVFKAPGSGNEVVACSDGYNELDTSLF